MDKHEHNHNEEHEHDHGGAEPGSLWAGMLAGLLIGPGAIAMLLLAPQSGKRTRAKLRRQSYTLRRHTAEAMEDMEDAKMGKRTRAKLRRRSVALRVQTAETMENMEDAIEDARDKTHQMTHDARKQAEKLDKRGHALFDG